MNQAYSLIEKKSANINKSNLLENIVSGYATVDAEKGFQLTESLLPELNNQTKLSSKTTNQNELTINAYGNFYNLDEALQSLKKSDLNRTIKFIEKIERPEIRISLLLKLLQDRQYSIVGQLIKFTTCKN